MQALTATEAKALVGLSEAQFQAMVVQLARLRGWAHYHTHDSRRSAAGFPDLVLVRERVVFMELKSEKGAVKPEQRLWLARLLEAGAEAHLFRPSQWAEIEKVLE